MQSLLCAGSIWGRIQQPSWRVQPNAAPDQPPTSMSFMFSVLNTYVCVFEDFKTCVKYLCLCWILMSKLETYETYVCVGYLCWTLMFVMDIYVCVGYLCLWWYLWCIYVIYVISFVCLDGIGKTNKKGAFWSLCRVWYSAKRCFVECQDHSTRQRTKTWAPV
jgi:prolipoprotein diacylglyceryltransferase